MKQQNQLARLFIVMFALMLASIAGIYAMGAKVLNFSQQLAAQREVIDHLNSFLSTMKDAETGQRGYLLTGEASYLDPYHKALANINGELATLRRLAVANELPVSDVADLEKSAGAKLAELEHTISLRKEKGPDAALAEVRTDIGKNIMDQVRTKTNELLLNEEQQFQDDQRDSDRLTRFRTSIFIAAVVANLIFLSWAFGRIRAEMEGKHRASLEVERQKDLLAVTLASIGDAVIVTDNSSRITFVNEIAAKLTGWTPAEAIGQLCTTVFNIVNEETRQPVESPVQKVLRLGVIVGLANHTVLIRKDGSEIPIDDSGAPIREPDGTVRGVVLIFRDFSEHKATEKRLLKAKAEVEAASQAKDQFLAALSHELRTPLTPVLATLTGWEVSAQLPPGLAADIQMLRRNLELEARLIDDLLDLTRIEKGKLRLNPEVADIHELVEATAGMYQSEIDAKKLIVTIRLNAERHFVTADPARLQQVFWNILKNAAKFTADKGKITISSEDDASGIVKISITDNGIGMSADTLGRLFRPFEQGGENTTRRYGGLGLGMAISKALMDAQGGQIIATSPGEGLGSTFFVTMPSVFRPAGMPAAVRPSTQVSQSRHLRILLVEDHTDTARAMSGLLKKLGHEVQISNTVAAANELLREQKFDLLLSDIGLPDGTGIDLVRNLRQQYDHQMPAVALTGYGMEEDIAKCKEAGFDEHLTKPVSFQRLEMLIRKFASAERA